MASSLNIGNLKPGGKYLIEGRSNVYDVVNIIKDIAKQSSKTPYIKQLANELQNEKQIFDYAYKNIVYVPDPDNEQNLRTLYNLVREKQGNCTAYTILISSLLLAKKIPHYLRVVGYGGPREYQHIYVVTKNGIKLDPVIGQPQDGTATLIERDGGHYNKEAPYKTKKDFPMKVNILNGIQGIEGCNCGGDCCKPDYRLGRLDGVKDVCGSAPFCFATKKCKERKAAYNRCYSQYMSTQTEVAKTPEIKTPDLITITDLNKPTETQASFAPSKSNLIPLLAVAGIGAGLYFSLNKNKT